MAFRRGGSGGVAGWLTGSVAAAACGAVALFAVAGRPRTFAVAGVSMAPGLLPGDRVATAAFPAVDALRMPRRFDRWVIALPDGERAIKRVAGLPGQIVAIDDGDLLIDGRREPPPPAVLAGRATAVEVPEPALAGVAADKAAFVRSLPAAEMLDDAAFAPLERRVLLPVRDVGLSAVVRLAADAGPIDVRITVGSMAVRWRIGAPGRHAFAAGRLDGHLVAASWPLRVAAEPPAATPLPPGAPATWDVVRPLADEPSTQPPDSSAPALGIRVAADPDAGGVAGFAVERLQAWRDAVYRAAADGVTEWRLGPDAFLLLGDHATGSRDSRHFGPLGRRALVHRVEPQNSAARRGS